MEQIREKVTNKDSLAQFLPRKREVFGNDKPFRLAIISSSGSGKSVLINEMLTNPSFGLVQKFPVDRIYVFSTTANKLDSAYDKLIDSMTARSTKDHEFDKETQFFTDSLDANLSMMYDTLYQEQIERK